jgi:glycine betaine catabolism B
MEEHIVRILDTDTITHDVKYFRVEKPEGYTFSPGQATDVCVNSPELKNEKRPFTFTSLTSSPYLEFMIKRYPEHKGVTDAIHKLNKNDELILHEVFGEISFKGKGVFIAGGAGITPFISILRNQNTKGSLSGNLLIFANKTKEDIILENELKTLLGRGFINILSAEKTPEHEFGYISEDFLKAKITDFNSQFYLCGPPPMMDSVMPQLEHLGVSKSRLTIEPM